MSTFVDCFIEKYRDFPNPLCVGLDPHVDRIPAVFNTKTINQEGEFDVQRVYDFLSSVIDLCVGKVYVIKPQSAFFEQFGWRGVRCLEAISHYAKDKGLLVILDAKRGDIGSTAMAYARAFLSTESPFDALTINPYMGLDTIMPFWQLSQQTGKGLFVLLKTSNSGGEDFQDQIVGEKRLYSVVASKLKQFSQRAIETSRWNGIGVVVGSMHTAEALAIRRDLPKSLFLIPGYGTQGGDLNTSVAGFVDHQGRLEGGIISASRSIIFAHSHLKSVKQWRKAMAETIAHVSAQCSAIVRAK